MYLSHCASCHDLGLDRAPQRAVLALMSPQSIHRALTQGVMAIQGSALTAAEHVAVAEFIANRSMDAAAKAADPPTCQGHAARFDHDEPPVFAGWGLTPGSTRFVSTAQAGIDRRNVQRLRLKWAPLASAASHLHDRPGLNTAIDAQI